MYLNLPTMPFLSPFVLLCNVGYVIVEFLNFVLELTKQQKNN